MPLERPFPLFFAAQALICCLTSAAMGRSAAGPPPSQSARTPPAASRPATPTLANATKAERETLMRLIGDQSWARRAIAVLRLERYAGKPAEAQLLALLHDRAWQVRAFAVRSLARRRVPAGEDWFTNETDPRVLRTALRFRYQIESSRLERGVNALAKSNDLKEKMLAAELGAASGDPELIKVALESAKLVILRMNRAEAGGLSPRLGLLTNQPDLHRPYQWQHWLLKTGRGFELQPAYGLDAGTDRLPPSRIAQLDSDQFTDLETYMTALGERKVDLAICLDCTASMGREIAAAQGGIDDMMMFIGDVVDSLRVALVAYRDRGDEFETKAWEFESDLPTLRTRLWQLSADGGGDEPEAVYPAIRLALTQLHWRDDCSKVMVIVGDAPPHVGYGAQCTDMVRRAREEVELTTHVIEAKGKEVKHFPEIAEAGGGRCVSLKDCDSLMAEVTGLTLGDRFQDEFGEFYQIYLELCR